LNREAYEAEAEHEARHWWFQGRRRLLARLLDRLALPPGARVLDVGCGTGANGPVLAAGRFAVGADASPIPLGLGRSAYAARLRADGSALPFADRRFDLVCALDVLEHLDDDAGAVRELRRVLRPDGVLIVFVPALRLLWGRQDEVSHHRRRYSRRDLRVLIAGAGLRIDRLTFFNTLLFPPILAARLAMRLAPPRALRSENDLGGGSGQPGRRPDFFCRKRVRLPRRSADRRLTGLRGATMTGDEDGRRDATGGRTAGAGAEGGGPKCRSLPFDPSTTT
jgi:SAM-dependent methyltransferase